MKNLFSKIATVYTNNSASIICGLLAINGASNTYRVYEALRNE